MHDNSQPDVRPRRADTDRSAPSDRPPAEASVTPALLAATASDLPTVEAIERFAAGGPRPPECPLDDGECAAKILLSLTRTAYRPDKEERLLKHAI